MRTWNNNELDLLRDYYPHFKTEYVATLLVKKIKSVYQKAASLGIVKTELFKSSEASGRLNKLSNAGVQFRFLKGSISWNKGRKGYMGANKTSFPKGNLPKNTLYDGAITIRKDKSKTPYYFIRISKALWLPLHRYTWEKENGSIPKGHVVRFKDGNTLNTAIENLICIPKSENMQKNTIHNYPPEIKQTIRTLSKLNKLIHEKQDSRSAQSSL